MPSREIEDFIARWSAASPSERANAQLLLVELSDLLGVPRPDPKPGSGYTFEFTATEHHPGGSTSEGRIDLYKRAATYTHARAGRIDAAIVEIRAVHRRRCTLRILDPACGSGNFLYVTFELLKHQEMEILDERGQSYPEVNAAAQQHATRQSRKPNFVRRLGQRA